MWAPSAFRTAPVSCRWHPASWHHPVCSWSAQRWCCAILAGAAISAGLAPPSLVIASAAAFLLSEFADFAVYTPLARRRLVAAVIASSVVGLVVDSIVFLWLAFGSLEFLI